MIRLDTNAAGEARVLLRFANGWSASIAPYPDGTAALAAWATHDDEAPFGRLRVSGGVTGGAEDLAAFLTEIANAPEVKSHDEDI